MSRAWSRAAAYVRPGPALRRFGTFARLDARSGKWTWGVILLAMAGLMVVRPGAVCAQESGLKVAIFRPGEGETLYSNPSAPFAAIPVTGLVSANDFDLNQLQVRLEVLRGAQVTKSAALKPEKDGTFRVDVGINPNPVSDQAELEIGCDSRCHSMQNLILPAGAVRLRVTASDPLGHKAVAERSVFVDDAGYADLPVQVMIEGEPGRGLAGVQVVAATRLYFWRAREFSGVTDATGRATIHLERLSEAPTDYVLQIAPRIVNGTFVTGRVPVSVRLPPGATSLAPVTVVARAQRGQINGSLDLTGSGNLSGLRIRAVDLSTGGAHTAEVSQGKFSLSDLPLDKYSLALDDSPAGAQNVQAEPQTVDLGTSPVATATLRLAFARTVRGVVHDSNGNPLPFAWITTDQPAKVGRVGPTSGEFVLGGLSGERVLWVTAPGYWSKPIALNGDNLDITLTPQPDLRVVASGSGTITLPPPTIGTLSGNQLSLKRGWVWGKGASSFVINTPDVDIAVESGSFALEYFPGESSWLYVSEGSAQVTSSAPDGAIRISAGQMLAFGPGAPQPSPVALDDAAVRVLHTGGAVPVQVEADPAFPAWLRDVVEQQGIPFAQATILAGLGVVLLAAGGIVWCIRRRRQPFR
jgi:hypothetical protein